MLIRTVDFETTGVAPPALVIESGTCNVEYAGWDNHWLIGDPMATLHGADRIPPETRAIHHIRTEDIAGRAPFYAQPFVVEAVKHGVFALAAHHADFEDQWIGRVRGIMPIICTYKAALRLWPDAPGHSNQCLRYWLADQGLVTLDDAKAQPAHRAGPDAYATAHLLAAELKLATVKDLIQWTTEPKLLPTIPIGKQRGAKWADVEEGFLRWMLKTTDMDTDLKWNAERELKRRIGR
jgi:exodeoxyribonuclease X